MDLSFFQIMMVLSFLITLGTVLRLHRGIKILNARVTILSHLVRDLRGDKRAEGAEDAVQAAEFEQKEEELQKAMGRDFKPSGSENKKIRKARDLAPRRGVGGKRMPTPAKLEHIPGGAGLDAARQQVADLEAQLAAAQREREVLARHNLQLQEQQAELSAVSALLQDIEGQPAPA